LRNFNEVIMGRRGAKIYSKDGKSWGVTRWAAGFPYGYKEYPKKKFDSLSEAYVFVGLDFDEEEIKVCFEPDWIKKQLDKAKAELKQIEEAEAKEAAEKEIAELKAKHKIK